MKFSLFATIAALTAVAPSAFAQLGSGTRALESVCDDVYTENKKAEKLCVDFCDTKDCVEALTQDDQKKVKSCLKIKERFVENTGLDSLPCEPPTCPCWTQDEIEAITSVDEANSCPGDNSGTIEIASLAGDVVLAFSPQACSTLSGVVMYKSGEEQQACLFSVVAQCDKLGYPVV